MLGEQFITTTNLGTALAMSNVVTAYISSTGTQSYTLPINAAARYARLWFANTGSTWKAVSEMRVFGAPTPPQSVSKYYFLGKQRLAMRQNGKLTYLHGDQLGSASLATDAAGVTLSQQRYLPYGGLRWTQNGSVFPTDWQYTDQQRQSTHLTGIRMVEYYDYRARMYDPKIGRFISPDSVVPDEKNPQSLNRYMYTLGNPIKFTDPDGHCSREADDWCYEGHPLPPNANMRMSAAGIANLARWEGYRQYMYNDDAGNCTIGIGTLVHTGQCGTNSSAEAPYSSGLTVDQAVQKAQSYIDRLVNLASSIKTPLNQKQFDALISAGYNLGEGLLEVGNRYYGEFTQFLNEGKVYEAAKYLLTLYRANDGTAYQGLINRRHEEAEALCGCKLEKPVVLGAK